MVDIIAKVTPQKNIVVSNVTTGGVTWSDLVDLTSAQDGDILVYSANNNTFVLTKTLDTLTITNLSTDSLSANNVTIVDLTVDTLDAQSITSNTSIITNMTATDIVTTSITANTVNFQTIDGGSY